MKLRFACRKFYRLISSPNEGAIRWDDQAFMDRHRAECSDCRRHEEQFSLALNMLREASFDGQSESNFDSRVLRRFHVDRVRSSVGYWSPAILGAGIAMIVMLAAIQLVSRSSDLPVFNVGGAGVKRAADAPAIPLFENRSPSTNR